MPPLPGVREQLIGVPESSGSRPLPDQPSFWSCVCYHSNLSLAPQGARHWVFAFPSFTPLGRGPHFFKEDAHCSANEWTSEPTGGDSLRPAKVALLQPCQQVAPASVSLFPRPTPLCCVSHTTDSGSQLALERWSPESSNGGPREWVLLEKDVILGSKGHRPESPEENHQLSWGREMRGTLSQSVCESKAEI